jgi:CheY-like chemotaxis protein
LDLLATHSRRAAAGPARRQTFSYDSTLEEGSPNILLLDLMMPEMDGLQVVAALQANPAWRDIPVVVVTALDLTAEDHRRLHGRRAGRRHG